MHSRLFTFELLLLKSESVWPKQQKLNLLWHFIHRVHMFQVIIMAYLEEGFYSLYHIEQHAAMA